MEPGDLAALLRTYRQRRWLTQEEVAERSGLHVRTIRRLEAGNLHPRRRTIGLLSDALGLDPEDRGVLLAAARDPNDPAAGDADGDRPAGAVPAQLPTDLATFVGRAEHLRRLDALLPDPGSATSVAVVISAIEGTAGIGKTALAVHWAHRVVDRFPDGQLYVNLRGFDSTAEPMSPAEALQGLLAGLGVPARRIPSALAERSALYRSLVAGRRFLVVLDNARDAAQVRPLLPGMPGCLVVVTSRNQLSGLVAVEGARSLSLEVLGRGEAVEMLRRRLGAGRVDADPVAVGELVERCGGLPLTLAIVAARAAARPGFPLAAIAAELRAADGALDAFATTDPEVDLRTVLSWSHRALGPGAARMFRLLGLHPGPDLAVPAAASLAAVPIRTARQQLAELATANLLTEWSPGRYTQHDLLRAYAAELADGDPDAPVRLLDHYLHSALAAEAVLNPARHPIAVPPPLPGAVVVEFGSADEANAWYTAEIRVLLAAVRLAADRGFHRHLWQLAWTLWNHLEVTGRWQERVAVQELAVAAVEVAPEAVDEPLVRRGLGLAYGRLGRYEDALPQFEKSIAAAAARGDLLAQAHGENALSTMNDMRDNRPEALAAARRSLALFEAAGDLAGQADSSNNVGWSLILMGEFAEGLEYCRRSLRLTRELGDRFKAAYMLDSIGTAYFGLGRYADAERNFREAIDLFEAANNRYQLADTLGHLGECALAAGDGVAAVAAWERAVEIRTELDKPSEELLGKLSALRADRPDR